MDHNPPPGQATADPEHSDDEVAASLSLAGAVSLGTATGVFGLFMYVSMVINESLVARTFGAYLLQIVDLGSASFWVPTLGVALLVVAFAINLAGNQAVQATAGIMAVLKVGGLAIFAVIGLVYKGFTTITNSGGEIVDPHRNTGRAIMISIAICSVIYLVLAVTVAGNLTLTEIIDAENFAIARAAEPAFGQTGLWFTVAIAVIATASGVTASVFAASSSCLRSCGSKPPPTH